MKKRTRVWSSVPLAAMFALKRKTILASTIVFALAFAAIFLPVLGSRAQAQPGCMAFHAIIQGSLPTPNRFLPTDTWGGPIYATLGGEFLSGTMSGNDGDLSPHGTIGTGRGGSYKVCFGDCTDSFRYEVSNAVWPFPPGHAGFGQYKGNTATIVGGTGRFEFASGNLNVAGPFVLWRPPLRGRWNGEITGSICGVQ